MGHKKNNNTIPTSKWNILRKSHGNMTILLSTFSIILGFTYSLCLFIYENHENSKQIEAIKADINERHKEIVARFERDERDFQLTSEKLDVSLTKISTDLQFIKEYVIDRKKGKK